MDVDLSACVAKLFAELDLDSILADLAKPVETEIELTGRVRKPAPVPQPAR